MFHFTAAPGDLRNFAFWKSLVCRLRESAIERRWCDVQSLSDRERLKPVSASLAVLKMERRLAAYQVLARCF